MTKKDIIVFTLLAFALIAITGTFSIQGVDGNSMSPSFSSGDYILVMANKAPKDGDVVILDTSRISKYKQKSEHIIKRYYADKSKTGYYVLGDNPSVSYDSRYFGEVEKEAYEGCVVFNITQFKVP